MNCGKARLYLRAVVVALACLAAVNAGLAQQPRVTDAPPPIKFTDWTQGDEFENGTEYDVTFPSPVTSDFFTNDVVPLKILVPNDPTMKGPFPVVVVLHYWGAMDLRAEFALADELNARGIAAAIMTLPYHLERTPPGHHSGDLSVPADPKGIVSSMTQAVLDVRRTIDFLQSRSEFRGADIGVSGTSLGSLVAALSYGVDSRIDYGAFVLGGADLAHIVWTSSRVAPQREALRHAGMTEDDLREILRPIEPLTYLPRKTPSQTFIIGARYDTVVTPQSTRELMAALPNSKSITLDTGHYGGIFVEHKILREVAIFFDSTFHSKAFDPPQKLRAPTVRIGALGDTANGVGVGVGLDLAQFDPLGANFLDAFLTPKGPQLVLAHRLDYGFALSAVFSAKGAGIGIFWSSVL